jgi:hypothetical protein
MQSNILRIELLIASIFPTAAILVVGVVGIEQMQAMDVRFFLTVLLASALVVFYAEHTLISFMQRATRKQFDELVLVCQDYLGGNRERRPDIFGDNALSSLARALHTLLDAVSQSAQPASPHADVLLPVKAKNSEQTQQLDIQLQKLIREIMPVTNGDLRVRAEIPQGNIGIIADLCNAFIEEVIELVQWTRYSSTQITNGTRTLLNCSIDLAQTAETQMHRFSQTTKTVETLSAFLENLCSTLQLNVKAVQEIQTYMSQYAADTSFEEKYFLQCLETGTKRQEQLLEEVLNSAQSNVTLARSLVSDFYTSARRIYESSAGILQAAEHIKSISALAEQWYNAVIAFQLPVDVEEKILQASTSTSIACSPSILPTIER